MKKVIATIIGSLIVAWFTWLFFNHGIERSDKYFASLLKASFIGLLLELALLWFIWIIDLKNLK